jgi:hypothetical protein
MATLFFLDVSSGAARGSGWVSLLPIGPLRNGQLPIGNGQLAIHHPPATAGGTDFMPPRRCGFHAVFGILLFPSGHWANIDLTGRVSVSPRPRRLPDLVRNQR